MSVSRSSQCCGHRGFWQKHNVDSVVIRAFPNYRFYNFDVNFVMSLEGLCVYVNQVCISRIVSSCTVYHL